MNLVQVQEHLKGMPTQVVMAYANGQNPQVPPYVALGELNRRKQLEQPQAQAPQGSVKEQIEQSLMQPQQLPGMAGPGVPVQQPPQPQGMPTQMPQRMAMAPQQQPPAQGMPVQGMAGGGLASVPVRRDMFNYAPGGIVAFADEDNNQVVVDEAAQRRGEAMIEKMREKERAAANPVARPSSASDVSALANQVLMDRLAGKTGVNEIEDPEVIRARMAQKYPILNTLPGAKAEELATKLEAMDRAQEQKFKTNEGPRGLAALSNALIQAGEATRGQKGSGNQLGSAFGGFGRAYNASTEAELERGEKQDALMRSRLVDTSKIRSDVENLQRAQAEGRVQDAAKYQDALNKQIADVEREKGTAAAAVLKHQIDLAHLAVSKAQLNKPSTFAEQIALLKSNPDLYEKYQGVNKTGQLTFEDALKVVSKEAKDNGEMDLSPEDKVARAQKYLDAFNRMKKTGSAVDPDAPAPPAAQPKQGIMDALKARIASVIAPTTESPPGYDPSKVRLKGQ
jgi:hypothetical protein